MAAVSGYRFRRAVQCATGQPFRLPTTPEGDEQFGPREPIGTPSRSGPRRPIDVWVAALALQIARPQWARALKRSEYGARVCHEHADGVRRLGLGSAPTRYEAAAFTSATTFVSTAGVHSMSAYDVGHIGPSSRLAASSNPSVA